MKKINTIFLALIILCAGFIQVNAQVISNDNTVKSKTTNIYQNTENENIYLELNDKVLFAIDNYNNGNISKDEYLEIMGEIKEFLDYEENFNTLKEDEAVVKASVAVPYANTCTSGGGSVETYLYFGEFTSEEILLFSTHPIKSAEAALLSQDASEKTNSLYSEYTLWQGNGDAFRHAYWSALMTKNIDRDYAYDAGLAHEGLQRGYSFDSQPDDTKMDISNNYSGRILGDENSSLSDNQLATLIKNQVSAGNLKRIRTYTSNTALMDCQLYGVMTRYVGYYVATSDGGLK